jgi:glucose-1-phosphate adenylyltransferase
VPDEKGRNGETANVMVSGGCIVSGSDLRESVLFSNVRVHSCCHINQAVLLPDCDVGRGCRLSKVVVDRGCRLPPGLVIGDDAELDGSRFHRSDGGVVLVTRAMLERLDG